MAASALENARTGSGSSVGPNPKLGRGPSCLEGTELLERAAQLAREGRAAAMCTIVRAEGSTPRGVGARMLVVAGEGVEGTIGGGALERHLMDRYQDGPPEEPVVIDLNLEEDLEMSCGGSVSILVEQLGSPPRLYVFGAGHIARALAPMAREAGFVVTVVDELPEFASAERFPGADTLVTSFDDPDWSSLRLDSGAFCVVVTRDHASDRAVLGRLVGHDVAYLGMIGSRRKVAATVSALKKQGVSDPALGQVHAPIGLNIGAQTPAEIAVSILAQMISIRRQGVAGE